MAHGIPNTCSQWWLMAYCSQELVHQGRWVARFPGQNKCISMVMDGDSWDSHIEHGRNHHVRLLWPLVDINIYQLAQTQNFIFFKTGIVHLFISGIFTRCARQHTAITGIASSPSPLPPTPAEAAPGALPLLTAFPKGLILASMISRFFSPGTQTLSKFFEDFRVFLLNSFSMVIYHYQPHGFFELFDYCLKQPCLLYHMFSWVQKVADMSILMVNKHYQ